MANHKSALKKHRRDEQLRLVNKRNRSRMKTKIKSLRRTIVSGEIKQAENLFPDVMKTIDRTVSKGTIHWRRGARYKSRLTHLMRKAGADI